MITLYEGFTEKILDRKPISIKLILHDSEIKKIINTKHKDIINLIIEKGDNLFWEEVFNLIPKVKLDNRFKIGEYFILNQKNFFLKIRNPNRFKKQILELCYKDDNSF